MDTMPMRRAPILSTKRPTNGAVTIHQDVQRLVANLKDEQETSYTFKAGRGGVLHVAKGWISLNGEALKEGDGADISDVDTVKIKAKTDSEVLLFDLA
jgi:hypothetical protein